ncbi:MAG: Rieske 2Fe-2S domain-containing protein [Pseudomonadales bacterium]|nr:Rieske 2Fe-2S domain-containing protein [Pseudomonadales bacterium]
MQYSIWDKDFSAWLIAARSEQVTKKKVYKRKLMKREIVLFRNKDGEVAALKDQCPHKGLPLSQGHMRDGNVVCGYHGWAFDVSGSCVKGPCLNPNETCPTVKAESYTVKEQDGWVWLFWGSDEKVLAEGPPSFPQEKEFKWFELEREIKAQPHFILENSFDCTHACFVHNTYFRNGPVQLANAELKETDYGMHVQTREEDGRKVRITKYLPWKGKEVYHTDEYFKPFTAYVNYHFGLAKHRIILTCSPEDENTTRVYTRTGIQAGPFSSISAWVLKYLTPVIVAEDIEAIEGQARSYSEQGGHYGQMKDADVPAVWMFAIYRRFFENRETDSYRTKQIQYRL